LFYSRRKEPSEKNIAKYYSTKERVEQKEYYRILIKKGKKSNKKNIEEY
jgi:hypothetical protein